MTNRHSKSNYITDNTADELNNLLYGNHILNLFSGN